MREPPIYDSMGQTHLTTAVAHTHTRMYIYILYLKTTYYELELRCTSKYTYSIYSV